MSALKNRALGAAALAVVGTLWLATIASADSFSSTLTNPTSYTTPASCPSAAFCVQMSGMHTSSIGGSGSYPYTIVDVVSTAPYPQGTDMCVKLDSGSKLIQDFSSGSITMDTSGTFCGAPIGPGVYAVSGTYKITGGTVPFDKVSGNGTISGTYNSYSATLIFSNISGVINLGGGGSGGVGGGGGPGLGATPELDSLLLFGGGALGLAGYAITRARARGKRPSVSD